MTVMRMSNMAKIVADQNAAVGLFTRLGLILQGRTQLEGEWACRVTGLAEQMGGKVSRADPMRPGP